MVYMIKKSPPHNSFTKYTCQLCYWCLAYAQDSHYPWKTIDKFITITKRENIADGKIK